MKKLTATILGVILIGTLATGCSSNKESASINRCPVGQYFTYEDEKCREYEDIYEDTSWIPNDFNSYSEDSKIAWRWAKSNEVGEDANWGIMILAKDGCSSMYSEINIFDKNDIQIDYTNESTSTIQPMQKVLLSFSTYEDRAHSAQVAEFLCR